MLFKSFLFSNRHRDVRSFTGVQKFLRHLLLIGIALLYAAPSYAQTAGVEVKSENFILMGDISQREGERLIKDLEIFRLSLFKMLKLESEPEAVPVKIYAFKSGNTFQGFVSNKTVAGVYKKGIKGPMFVLNAQGGFKEGDSARRVAMHEYVHHVIATYTNQKFPRWYNEGYANFLANFKIKKGKFIIGAPDRNYGLYLKNGGWMPMDVLIASVDRYPFQSGSTKSSQRNLQDAFYAQSWLAVTYLQTHPEYARNSGDYLRRINRRENSLQAFNASFGQTPEEFGVVLKKFLKKNNFLHYPFPLSKDEKNPKMTVRKLDKTEFDSKAEQARINFVIN